MRAESGINRSVHVAVCDPAHHSDPAKKVGGGAWRKVSYGPID